jgi:hypothetical protein
MAKEKNEVATQAEAPKHVLVGPPEGMESFQFDPSDVTLPRILLAQSTSAVVKAGEVEDGAIRNSLTNEVIGGEGNPVEIIPLSFSKCWTVLSKKGNKFIRTIPWTASNKDMPWEDKAEDRDGNMVEVINQQTFQFMVLISKGLENDEILPAQISFKSKSLRAGKDLNSFILQKQAMGKPAYLSSAMLSCKQETNDSGTFYTFTMGKGKPTTPEQQKWAKLWVDQLKAKSFKVDTAEESDIPASPDESEATY